MLLLDTADLPRQARAEAIHAAMLAATAPCHLVLEDPSGDVHARMDLWGFGTTVAWRMAASGMRMVRTPQQAAQEVAPVVAIGLQESGRAEHVQAGSVRTLRPGDMLLSDLSAPYEYAWSGNGAARAFHVPLEHLGVPLDVVRRAASRLAASPLYDLVRDHLARVAANADRFSADPGAAALGVATTELIRALLTSAAGDQRDIDPAPEESLPTRILAYVGQHLTDPDLRPSTVAVAHSISVRQLYNVCAEAGLSLEQEIIARRLEAARAELARPASLHRPIAVVARRWGFADPTHFGRRFRGAYGTTPSDWRRRSIQSR